MNNFLAGFIIAVTLSLYVAWLRTAYKLRKIERAAQRLVAHTRPGGGYDMGVVALDFVRDMQFLVGDKVSDEV